MTDEERRQQLAEFLKLRRARIAPVDLGFQQGRRRRAPGLRREEVAASAGIGLTWYTALEQAKPIRVSASFLDNLAEVLRLSEAERAHLFALAHRRPPPARFDGDNAAPTLQPLLDLIQSPAYARTTWFDVLAWNAANTRQFGDFAAVPPRRRNVLRLFFLRAYHRRAMPEWEADAMALVAKFRLALGEAAAPEPFRALLEELLGASPDFRRLWSAHEVSKLGEGVTHLASPRHGELHFRHHTMIPEAASHLRVVIFTPLPSDS